MKVNKLRIIYVLFLMAFSNTLFAQTPTDTSKKIVPDTSKLTFSGYAEVYYDYDFNHPENNTRPPFLYNYTRTNEVSLNLAFIKAAYTANNVRANLSLMTGTYANANLAAEPGVLKNIYEANVGIKLTKKANLWLDAGVFSSHIGFESAIGQQCWTLTRSIVAENSPYYESGAKVSYTTNDGKLFVSGLLLNGWQHIERPDSNTSLSAGLQITWQPTSAITLNYSNFYGSDKPDSAKLERFYNDFYAIIALSKQFGLTAGVDYATQQKYKGASTYNKLVAPVFIFRYTPASDFAIAARFEYYQDPNGILIATNTVNGFKTTGYSLNVDYSPYKNIMLRIEGKYYDSKDPIFTRNGQPVNGDAAITTSMSIAF